MNIHEPQVHVSSKTRLKVPVYSKISTCQNVEHHLPSRKDCAPMSPYLNDNGVSLPYMMGGFLPPPPSVATINTY